jgi:hypothetical protein
MGRAFKNIAIIFVKGDRLIAFKGDHSQRDIMMLYSMRGQCLRPLYARKSPYRDEPLISSSVIERRVCFRFQEPNYYSHGPHYRPDTIGSPDVEALIPGQGYYPRVL